MSGGRRCARQHESAIERRRDVVGMCGAAAGHFAAHRALEQHVERRRAAEQLVDRDDRRDRAGAAAADAAGERHALVNREADAPSRPQPRRAAPSTAAPAVLRAGSRDSRPPSPSMATISTPATVGRLGDDDVARRVERKAEHVEAAGDVRDRCAGANAAIISAAAKLDRRG